MATIDIKLKSYDELIFEITKLNTDKYLLQQENKQLKEKIEKLKDYGEKVGERRNELYDKIDKAIEYIKWQYENPTYDNVWRKYEVEKLLEILGDKE
ncbi:MAG: hypothetical protein IIZ40_04070 [Bacilli bacterium]|nr:hypothetical protein [Bacilli bacterium]